ncbi:hypothetical protein [Longitalea luteola]|uniref:hypothetical protein n=1 Tax=Longitalea luteola TaxID=2812563 RepID=UPI001A971067|nr:hypothetical protein [Longitalea luteola]
MDKDYNDIPLDKELAEKIFASKDVKNICHALVAIALNEQDWKWVQDKCLYFFMSNNSEISGLAATCLGHVARIHGKLEKDKVISILRTRLNEPEIAGIGDALDDIEMFIKG